MTEDVKLPGSSLDILEKIIRGYSELEKEVRLDDLVKLLAMSKTVISSNNPALIELGIIEGTHSKNITPLGQRLGRALDQKYKEEIINSYKEVVRKNEFLSNMLSTVRIKGPIVIDDLLSHILYASGQNNTKHTRTGARALVDLLIKSTLLEENEGNITLAELHEKPEDLDTPISSKIEDDKEGNESKKKYPDVKLGSSQKKEFVKLSEEPKLVINIQLQIPATDNPDVYDKFFEALKRHLFDSNNNNE